MDPTAPVVALLDAETQDNVKEDADGNELVSSLLPAITS